MGGGTAPNAVRKVRRGLAVFTTGTIALVPCTGDAAMLGSDERQAYGAWGLDVSQSNQALKREDTATWYCMRVDSMWRASELEVAEEREKRQIMIRRRVATAPKLSEESEFPSLGAALKPDSSSKQNPRNAQIIGSDSNNSTSDSGAKDKLQPHLQGSEQQAEDAALSEERELELLEEELSDLIMVCGHLMVNAAGAQESGVYAGRTLSENEVLLSSTFHTQPLYLQSKVINVINAMTEQQELTLREFGDEIVHYTWEPARYCTRFVDGARLWVLLDEQAPSIPRSLLESDPHKYTELAINKWNAKGGPALAAARKKKAQEQLHARQQELVKHALAAGETSSDGAPSQGNSSSNGNNSSNSNINGPGTNRAAPAPGGTSAASVVRNGGLPANAQRAQRLPQAQRQAGQGPGHAGVSNESKRSKAELELCNLMCDWIERQGGAIRATDLSRFFNAYPQATGLRVAAGQPKLHDVCSRHPSLLRFTFGTNKAVPQSHIVRSVRGRAAPVASAPPQGAAAWTQANAKIKANANVNANDNANANARKALTTAPALENDDGEADPAHIAVIVELGFPHALAMHALAMSNNDLDAAVEYCLSNPTTESNDNAAADDVGADAHARHHEGAYHAMAPEGVATSGAEQDAAPGPNGAFRNQGAQSVPHRLQEGTPIPSGAGFVPPPASSVQQAQGEYRPLYARPAAQPEHLPLYSALETANGDDNSIEDLVLGVGDLSGLGFAVEFSPHGAPVAAPAAPGSVPVQLPPPFPAPLNGNSYSFGAQESGNPPQAHTMQQRFGPGPPQHFFAPVPQQQLQQQQQQQQQYPQQHQQQHQYHHHTQQQQQRYPQPLPFNQPYLSQHPRSMAEPQQPQTQQVAPSAITYYCAACKEYKSAESFFSNLLGVRDDARRCISCVKSGRGVNLSAMLMKR